MDRYNLGALSSFGMKRILLLFGLGDHFAVASLEERMPALENLS
jgi:hypothetical protein